MKCENNSKFNFCWILAAFLAFNSEHTRTTEFPRVWVWVRVGYPQLTIYPRQPKYSGFQLTIYPKNCFKIYSNKYLVLFQMNMIRLSVLKNRFSVGHPNISVSLGYIVSCGYPAHIHTHTRGNSVAHV